MFQENNFKKTPPMEAVIQPRWYIFIHVKNR